jgi:hypothetical protein
MRTKLAILGEYVGHLVVGAAMFAALLFFGVALHLLADWAETLLADRAFFQLMRFVERVILYSDVALLVWWTGYSTYKAIGSLHDE